VRAAQGEGAPAGQVDAATPRHKLGTLDDYAAAFRAAVPPVDLPLAETCAAMCAAGSLDVPLVPSARTQRRRTCT
jgi:hypothetical protein